VGQPEFSDPIGPEEAAVPSPGRPLVLLHPGKFVQLSQSPHRDRDREIQQLIQDLAVLAATHDSHSAVRPSESE
jgi:hypothetical protein